MRNCPLCPPPLKPRMCVWHGGPLAALAVHWSQRPAGFSSSGLQGVCGYTDRFCGQYCLRGACRSVSSSPPPPTSLPPPPPQQPPPPPPSADLPIDPTSFVGESMQSCRFRMHWRGAGPPTSEFWGLPRHMLLMAVLADGTLPEYLSLHTPAHIAPLHTLQTPLSACVRPRLHWRAAQSLAG